VFSFKLSAKFSSAKIKCYIIIKFGLIKSGQEEEFQNLDTKYVRPLLN